MKIYLVGGAVRDKLLGRPFTERDWVVVGSTPEEMLKQGFQPVGKDFPVFLHPETHEEYALARTERKTAPGYQGFEFHAEPSVTLEEDLRRRDLTINAIAETEKGELIDPFQGKVDIEARILRHVSAAFVEDPVRILRLARFAARFPEFSIAEKTEQLMETMVESGEVNALVSERVWQEFHKALQEKEPPRFFDVLSNCGALAIIFPELAANPTTLEALQTASKHSDDPLIRFIVLLSPLKDTAKLCHRLRAPKEYKELAGIVAKNVDKFSELDAKSPEQVLYLLEKTDAFRRPERFENIVKALEISCLNQGSDQPPRAKWLTQALEACKALNFDNIDKDLIGKDIADAIHVKRLKCVEDLLNYPRLIS